MSVVTFVCDIFAQVVNTMENSECCVGEDVSLTLDATDDSCITQFIEIIPVHISRKDSPNTVQVKDEFTADIKQEPEDLCEVYGPSAVNVSFFVFFFSLIKKIAVVLLCHNYHKLQLCLILLFSLLSVWCVRK